MINVIDERKLFGFIALIAGAICMFIESYVGLLVIGALCITCILIYRNEWLTLAQKIVGKLMKKK